MALSSSTSSSDPFIANAEKHGYSKIKTSDDEEAELYIPRARQSSRLLTVLSYVVKLVIVAMAVYGLITMGISAVVRLRKAAVPPCNCGSSIAEALTLDCKYDSLSTSWLPPHCRDDEMTSLFEKSGPGPNGQWNYYASNLNTSKVFTIEEMALMAEKPDSERQAWATIEWHDKHCFFTLLKQVRGRAKMQYTGFPSGTAHAEHCAMGMAERRPGKQIVVSMNPGFGDAKPGELKMMIVHMGHQ
ncbi:hypothetical protein T069G_10171 [Trichoderma breve]|uniref:Uncharacterized protein n=1 Tax=Trichoderma breve TaxID=2034170 RepID=A0A9W9E2T1_9HYPO|nr:hypothetical protein T069G_10171 [Trichoderma breve]KAJ4856803.1 hypothetical protein T069G_10171 [Trichoderma breve]